MKDTGTNTGYFKSAPPTRGATGKPSTGTEMLGEAGTIPLQTSAHPVTQRKGGGQRRHLAITNGRPTKSGYLPAHR